MNPTPRLIPSVLPRLVALGLGYAFLTTASFLLAYQLRFDFEVPPQFAATVPNFLVWAIPIRLIVLFAFRQFHFVLRTFSATELPRLILATGLSTAIFLAVRIFAGVEISPPRGVLAIEGILFVGLVSSTRLTLREFPFWFGRQKRDQRAVVLIGAGNAGEQLLEQFRRDSHAANRVIAFFDDNPDLHRKTVRGVRVHSPIEALEPFTLTHTIDQVIVAMPSAPVERIREVVNLCRSLGIDCVRIPSLVDILTGKERIDKISKFQPEDFLNRQPVAIDPATLSRFAARKHFLVTGAGGSIGSEICRQLIALGAARIIAVDRSEHAIFNLTHGIPRDVLQPHIADISRPGILEPILRSNPVHTCFHAAAYKHVPLMEDHPLEAFENNCIGTFNTIDSCERTGVERFCFISTDKVVAPANVMGLTKKISEDLIINRRNGIRTCAVRFGNVLDSSGSVIPIFKKQIAAGGPVTVTDPAVTRYFMTIPEAVGLVLNATAFDESAAVYVLEMGEPVSIEELARAFIEAHGLRPDIDIPITYTGLRPGEKLHEALHLPVEQLLPTDHPKIRRIQTALHTPLTLPPADWADWLRQIRNTPAEPTALRSILFETFANPTTTAP